MQNNIFFKIKKDKFNPDVENLLNNKKNDREVTKYDLHKSIYNPITGVVPDYIKTQNDLALEKDKSLSDSEIRRLILEKEKDRKIQDELYKPIKTKMVMEETEPEDKYNVKINYLETYEQMKNNSKQIKKNNNNLNDIMKSMKDLGIIKD